MVNQKDMLKAIDFWEANHPNRLREVPKELEKHKKEILNRQSLYRERSGKLTSDGLRQLRKDTILETNQEKDLWNKLNVKIGIVVGIIAIITFILQILGVIKLV